MYQLDLLRMDIHRLLKLWTELPKRLIYYNVCTYETKTETTKRPLS